MTDINPQWRLVVLTELFGPVGKGWYTDIREMWTTPGAEGTVVAWCRVELYYREDKDSEWSKPVMGVGGSMLVAKEKSGLHTSDEAFKMAETDAIGVCCKKLGIAADIYWQHGSKYSMPTESNGQTSGQSKGDDNPMPDNFPNEKEMQQNFTSWIDAAKKFRKLETLNEFLRDNDKQIKHELGGADSPFVLDFREWVAQRREELSV